MRRLADAVNRELGKLRAERLQFQQGDTELKQAVTNISHDLRTPLTAICGYLDLLEEEEKPENVERYVAIIRNRSDMLIRLTEELFRYSIIHSREKELAREPVVINHVLEQSVAAYYTAFRERNIIPRIQMPEEKVIRMLDRSALSRVCSNLIHNAIKYSDGDLDVTLEPTGEIIFANTAEGLDEVQAGRLFDRFYTVETARRSTGLGLAIVKHLVELMGGTICVESDYGKGTTVSITIPQRIVDRRSIAEAPELFETEQEHSKAFTAPDVKVLIVDDNLINRKVARGLLKMYAFDLAEAESGQEAIELVRQNRYDIIFMDHMMPVMDGIEAAEIIRRDCGENGTYPAIIALTANAMEGMREQFLSRGFQDFIAKPLDRKALEQLLVRWVPEERRQEGGGEKVQDGVDLSAFRINGIDTDAASRYFTGDEEGFADLLELYYMDGQRKTALLCELVDSDIARYCVEVHALKSASANIGAVNVSDMARAQENAAAQNDRELIDRQFPALLAAYEKLLKNIGMFLERRHQDDPQEEMLPTLPLQELKERVGTALNKLENFRSQECAGMVEDILRHALPRDAADSLKEIQGQLKLYEDDDAEELLRQLLSKLEKEVGANV